MPTPFEQMGGEQALRRVVDRFVDRLFDDLMIGFFFARAERARVKEKEYEFAARHLGASVEYTGRPLETAHRAHRIFDGQFSRRLKLLEETLDELRVPEEVKQHWLAHTQGLRDTLVAGPCNPELPGENSR